MQSDWNFLAGTYWFVPATYLPALSLDATEGTPVWMIDQTVWEITGSSGGYFWGNCAVLMYQEGTEPDTAPGGYRFAGSITPEGNVQMSFMPLVTLGAALSTSGWGRIVGKSQYAFEMQMATGFTDVVIHWAFMEQTREGDPSWEKLPGVDYSVPDFLAAAGF